ncbi:hypothetical protein [Pedobacter deserti]|uniref:hypothetical protein n=1 Tax=Pedobacter deserti TaxID=2817382 RepID=UPI002108D599|nr:hypothetical protein [Pedobacter sp. SYSU D00382]
MGLSNLGIFHTVVGIVAIVAALVSFVRYRGIALSKFSGKVYLYTTLVTSLTALGVSKHGGFNAGHGFSLFIVVLVLIAAFLHYKKQSANRARYFANFLLSLSFFLSLIPTVNETMTRVPVGHPLAAGPTDPLIAKTILGLFVLFITGSVYQFFAQRKVSRDASNDVSQR